MVTRGWTLQELIAPDSVEFFSSDDKPLGDKKSLEQQLNSITGIAPAALRGGPLDSFSVEERMAWAEKRITKKEEDKAYSLLGIFGIFMLLIYGEGAEHAFYRLNQKIKERAKALAAQSASERLPLLRSDSIFLQERLLVRADIKRFLTDALSGNGHARVVLHGLPGIGKSTMARSFAHNAQRTTAVLWVPGTSEATIKQAFEQYALQLCGNDQQHSEPVSLVARQLIKRFSGQCLVVFDGLDDPLINIQRYLFTGLTESKVLITTRNRNLASYIQATHVRHMSPLDEQNSQDLLSLYMDTNSASLSSSQAVLERTPQEVNARRRIVNELGGLPLAIATVGAALRREDGIPAISSQSYLAWADEVKDILFRKDPMFSDYPSSVWKTFQFAFQSVLQGTGNQQYAASMAHFITSCENASNLTEYIRLYREFRCRNAASTRSAAIPDPSAVRQLRFLETEIFDLEIRALAAMNMVTVNWMEATPNDVPYIEMHSLLRRWLKSTNNEKVLTYAGSKMWLLGFGMYDQLRIGRIGSSRLEPLLKETSKILANDPEALKDNQVPASNTVFSWLLDIQTTLSKSVDFLPAGSAQRSRLHQFSGELESEITESYDSNLAGVAWDSVFKEWARELGEQIEDAVRSDAQRDDYALKDVLITIDSHGCIPIAFKSEAPYELSYVGQTDAIEKTKADITARTESLLREHLGQEAFRQLSSSSPTEWSSRWKKDVEDIIRRCLAEVFIQLHPVADTQHLATELSSPSITAAVADARSFGDSLRSLSSLRDPRNVFFAVLRRTVTAASEQYVESTSILEELDEQRDTFRDICERAIRLGFGDSASNAFHSQLLSAEAGTNTPFAILWGLVWSARFLGGLGSLIAEKTFNAISNDLKDAAKQGFSNVFESYCNSHSWSVEDLAYKIFSDSAICNLFPNWILSGWIDPLSDDEDSDEEEPTYISLLQESKRQTMSAMTGVYDNGGNIADGDPGV